MDDELPTKPAPAETWADLVAPMVRICEVAAAFQGEAVWDAIGARTLGKILKHMATVIDTEITGRASQGSA